MGDGGNIQPELDRNEHIDITSTDGAKRSAIYGHDGTSFRVIKTDFLGQIIPSSAVSAFGELLFAELSPIVQLQFPYGILSDFVNTTVANNGTVTGANAMAVVTTAAEVNSTALMESIVPIKYNSGQGGLGRFTALFTTGVANTLQQIGIGNGDNGYFVEINGTDFGINNLNGGVNNRTIQSNFSEDSLDGTGFSGMTIDVTKLNVFEIRFQYLCAGEIQFFIESNATGKFFCFHRIKYTNANTVPSLTNPTLPLRLFVDNQSTTSILVVKTGSMAGFVEGKNEDLGPLKSAEAIALAVSAGIETPILSIQNKTSFQSVTNRVLIKPILISAAVDGTKSSFIRIYSNVDLTNASFGDVDTANSVVEFDTAATAFSGGEKIFTLALTKVDADSELLSLLNSKLAPGQRITFTVQSANATDAEASLVWRELF